MFFALIQCTMYKNLSILSFFIFLCYNSLTIRKAG